MKNHEIGSKMNAAEVAANTPARACGAHQFLSFDPRTFVPPEPTVTLGDGRPRAALYVRVRTPLQSPEPQLKLLREYVQSNGLYNAGEYGDIDTTTGRLGATNLLVKGRLGAFDMVLSTRLSIIGLDPWDSISNIHALNLAAVRFIAADQPGIDTGEDAASGAALVCMLAGVAESFPKIPTRRRPPALPILARMQGLAP